MGGVCGCGRGEMMEVGGGAVWGGGGDGGGGVESVVRG